MSYGYESLITPLQTLTLYNAIANDGRMVKPRFEKEIQRNGKTVKTFTTEVIAEQIVKKETLRKAKQMLEGVVQNGTGKGLNITAFKVGGKTGTAQIAKAGKKGYGEVGNRDYQASFVGYFPADKPLYTCIVIINSPSNGIYYGGLVAGPVFKEIAEKVYSSSVDFLEPINNKQNLLTKAPGSIKSQNDEMVIASKALKLPIKSNVSENSYVSRNQTDSTHISLQTNNLESQLKKGIVPNLNGLSAKDALFLLENSGFHVKLYGMGSVKKQSIEAGQKFNKGDKITLILS
jgi:cell division protein FtsI (penicillin-binding protein 3)